MLYFQNENITIEWDTQNRWVKYTQKGFSQGEVLRAGALKMIELLELKKATKLLSDTIEMKVLDQPDQQWLNEVLAPKVLEAGVCYQAILVPKSVLAQLSVKSVMTKSASLGQNFEAMYFSNLEEAQAWLNSK